MVLHLLAMMTGFYSRFSGVILGWAVDFSNHYRFELLSLDITSPESAVFGYLERLHQRQRELSLGADADLTRTNRKRWKHCLVLFGCAFALLGIYASITLHGFWDDAAVALIMLSFGAGVFLGYWARVEHAFLNRPDPKEPPRLWK